eukprot:TRINITY_DN13241_c0_g1_i1.p1 TRINITY_DN13241_c0_g1~~TRINITY_DN13241_c0_g1_i1.p1  ORF type:complete len:162 (-),score=32.11 TRINITY_DN13241_c0_g1_i1:5-490(-)
MLTPSSSADMSGYSPSTPEVRAKEARERISRGHRRDRSISKKPIDREKDEVKDVIKKLKSKLELSSMEKAVEIARSIRLVKKDLEDFATLHGLNLKDEEIIASANGHEDKFTSLKNMMQASLDNIYNNVSVIAKEGSRAETEEKSKAFESKLIFMKNPLSS